MGLETVLPAVLSWGVKVGISPPRKLRKPADNLIIRIPRSQSVPDLHFWGCSGGQGALEVREEGQMQEVQKVQEEGER